jgi:hypothetical protein
VDKVNKMLLGRHMPEHLQRKHHKTNSKVLTHSKGITHSKGMIEVQFNWIFVLIAGFIIFLFIISIIMSQKKHADDLLNIELIQKITTTIRSKQQLSNTYSEVSIPDLKIYFSCDDEIKTADFRIEGSPVREPLNLEILFAQKTLSGNMLYIWTQDFSIPFTVTRFMYITSPAQLFVIYDTNQEPEKTYADMVYNDLPANITKVHASNSDLVTKISGYKNYKIICFNSKCPIANTYSFINITPSTSGLYTYGNVTFHKAPSINQRIGYISSAGLFGAIFSDDATYYECQMNRSFRQFEVKRALQYQRLLLLQPEIQANNSACNDALAKPIDTLRLMNNYNLANTGNIYLNIVNLQINNKDLGVKGCPQVY